MACDWHDIEAYADTSALTRQEWAWEFVRRNPGLRALDKRLHGSMHIETHAPAFQRITMKEVPEIGHFGLLFF